MTSDESDVKILNSYFDKETKTAFVEYVRPFVPQNPKNVRLRTFYDVDINVSWGRFDDVFDGI